MSQARSYDLLCRPWIPVVWRSGTTGEKPNKVGIREALKRAYDIQCISHTSPFIEFGLYRILVTIILDAYIVAHRRPTIGKMKAMIAEGHFDNAILDSYLQMPNVCFDLWDKSRPFLQMALVNGQCECISKMVAPAPSGTKITFWHHYENTMTSLNEDEAAQELCAVAPFCFDYAPKDICTIAGDPPLYVLVLGGSLFRTIIYNLPRPNGRLTSDQEFKGGPTWRCPIADASKIPRSPTHAQAWTWPVRQIRLMADEGSMAIGNAVNTSGAGKTAARERVRAWRDPNAGTITDAKGIRHIRATDLIPRSMRSRGQGDQNPMVFWRDLLPMCLIASEGEVLMGERVRSRPEAVTNAYRIAKEALLSLAVYGFVDKGGKNNKVFRTWFRSVLTLPTEVARDGRLSARAIKAFEKAQKVADTLQTALLMLRPPIKASKKKRPPPGRAETDSLAYFWKRLEPVLSRAYLDDLCSGDTKAEANLYENIRKEGRDAFQSASGPHCCTADGLFRIANARNWFERRLARLRPKLSLEKSEESA